MPARGPEATGQLGESSTPASAPSPGRRRRRRLARPHHPVHRGERAQRVRLDPLERRERVRRRRDDHGRLRVHDDGADLVRDEVVKIQAQFRPLAPARVGDRAGALGVQRIEIPRAPAAPAAPHHPAAAPPGARSAAAAPSLTRILAASATTASRDGSRSARPGAWRTARKISAIVETASSAPAHRRVRHRPSRSATTRPRRGRGERDRDRRHSPPMGADRDAERDERRGRRHPSKHCHSLVRSSPLVEFAS